MHSACRSIAGFMGDLHQWCRLPIRRYSVLLQACVDTTRGRHVACCSRIWLARKLPVLIQFFKFVCYPACQNGGKTNVSSAGHWNAVLAWCPRIFLPLEMTSAKAVRRTDLGKQVLVQQDCNFCGWLSLCIARQRYYYFGLQCRNLERDLEGSQSQGPEVFRA